jgi:type II secretory pathway pseudopilin PulG
LPPVHTKHQEPRTKNAARHGLTLIELLSSFVILAIIVSLLAMTLNSATDNWRESQARTRVVAQARAVMDTMVQDIRQAVADTNFPITLGSDSLASPPSYGATNNWIQFIRPLTTAVTANYAIEAVRYGVANSNGTFQLVRWTQPLTVLTSGSLPGTMSYNASLTTSTQLTLADGLAALRISPADTNSMIQAGAPVPPYFDIYFELLRDDDCRTVTSLSGNPQLQFVDRHVLRFSQRVFLPAVNKWNLP